MLNNNKIKKMSKQAKDELVNGGDFLKSPLSFLSIHNSFQFVQIEHTT